jgi:hypothetical protein
MGDHDLHHAQALQTFAHQGRGTIVQGAGCLVTRERLGTAP